MPTFASPIEETNGESPAQLGTTASPVPLSQDLVDDYPGGFLPAPPRALGSLQPISDHPEERKPPKVFRPLTIRGVTFPHRLWVAPMCMYSSDNGHATDHHFVFTGSMVQRGWQGIMLEATAILPEGRISPDDAGIWSDSHIEPLKRQVDFVHAHKGTIGIQLNHAGRKAGVLVPWMEDRALAGGYKSVVVADSHGGWSDKIIGPSDIPFDAETYALPKTATLEDIARIKEAFLEAVGRCKQIGFDFIEIHGAHGYLLHQFTDPISNVRTDQYGGSLENRLRLPLEIARAIRQACDGSLFYRVSATDWLEDHLGPEKGHPGEEEEYSWWGLEQTTVLAHRLAGIGVDLLDVTSGGNDPRPNIVGSPGYQVPFANHIKRNVPGLLVGAVGCITDAHQANEILEKGQADVVFFARTVLNHIDFPLQAAKVLGVAVQPLDQFSTGWVWEAKVKEKHGEESLISSEEDQVDDAIGHPKAVGFAD